MEMSDITAMKVNPLMDSRYSNHKARRAKTQSDQSSLYIRYLKMRYIPKEPKTQKYIYIIQVLKSPQAEF